VATETGAVFVAAVVPGAPIYMFDKDLVSLGNAIDKTVGFSRSFEVSPDGNKIYWSGYTTHQVTLYERADEFSAFDSVGAVIPGVDTESLTWQPVTGWLWVSAGSANDAPNRHPDFTTTWLANTWYAFDPAELAVNTVPTAKAMLSLVPRPECVTTPDAANCGRPRGLAFSPDGTIAYATTFGVAGEVPIQVFSATGTAIETLDLQTPATFTLEQNYPNPFNPQTSIQFAVTETGHATLRVFDMMGREVDRLVDRAMAPGTYQVTFDGAGRPSGTYLYRLEMNGRSLTGKMTLLK
jgi:DNA-binding beta-propeller fold protein YncE